MTLADDLQTVWQAPTTGARLKKRIVRAVIKEVVADIDAEAGEIILFLHWMGGVHTELRLPRRRRGQRDSTSQDIVTAVRQLVLIANDDLIAGILNRNKLTTGRGNRWTRERVTALRSHHKIPVYRPGRARPRTVAQSKQGRSGTSASGIPNTRSSHTFCAARRSTSRTRCGQLM